MDHRFEQVRIAVLVRGCGWSVIFQGPCLNCTVNELHMLILQLSLDIMTQHRPPTRDEGLYLNKSATSAFDFPYSFVDSTWEDDGLTAAGAGGSDALRFGW